MIHRGLAMKKTIVLLPGDRHRPGGDRAAVTVLREAAHEFHHQFDFADLRLAAPRSTQLGTPLPEPPWTLAIRPTPFWRGSAAQVGLASLAAPESGLLALPSGLGLYVNFGP